MTFHVKYNIPKMISLSLIFQRQLPSSNIVVSSNSNPYQLATTNGGGMHFILSDYGNFDFKIKCCKFVGFVKDVTDCRCLGCVFCFRIKDKEKDIFYINFYSIICLSKTFTLQYFPKLFLYFSLLELNNYNGHMCIIYNCFFL